MKTKFSKNLYWLEPFYNSVPDLVPLDRVKRVSSFKVPITKIEQTDAVILRYGNNKTFNIRIRTHSHELITTDTGIKFNGYQERAISPILDGLAHELSHLIHWEHTPDHFELQAKILFRFADVLKKLQVQDTWAKFPLI